MSEQSWLKYGAIALGVIGFLAIVGFAVNYGEGLEDRAWIVHEMAVDGTLKAPIPDVTPYAVFENGSVGGSAGCNTYNGGYEAGRGSITIGPVISTLMFCEAPDGTMDQEATYLSLLQSADSFNVDGDQLTLSDGDTVLIRYTEATVEPHSD
jgi:heat shock protein HslJ